MDKTWLWRKKSSEKIISVNDKVNLSSADNAGETLGHDKEDEMERSMNDLNQKLSSALSECNAKDELVTKHAKVAEEALAGWEKAEAEAVSFKQDLDEALRQRSFMEERMAHTDAALRECMQQLRFVREEQEQRVNDAVTKTSKQHEKVQRALEEKLADTSKRLAKLSVENNQLNNAVQIKEKSVEDLSRRITQLEADLSASMSKLQAKEKDDASLRYEHRMLQKELEIRNEEGEYNRRSADASHKQHLESVKKIAKLENECQRLRVLVRKRLPGPAAMAQMKNEVELLGKEPGETRRRRMNSPVGGSSMVKDLKQDNSPDSPSKRVNYLIERLYTMEEENKSLKETISKKNDDIQSSRVMCARTASKLSQVEAQLAEFSKGQMGMELARNSPVSHGSFLASISEVDASEDSESWASALISELDNFKNEKPKGSPSSRTVGGSEIGLMDDFVEMEKLAIVCVEKSFQSPHASSDGRDSLLGSLEVLSPSERTGKELVPVGDSRLSSGGANQEMRAKEVSIGKYPSWLQNILKIILQQTRLTLRSCDEIIEDVKNAMAQINGPEPGEVISSWKRSSLSSPSGPEHIGGLISWKSPNGSPVAYNGRTTQELQSQLNESICKIIELVEGVNRQSSAECNSQRILSEKDGTLSNYRNSVTPSGYTVRLFQWKSSELSEILQQFVHTCTDLLNGAADLEKFARDLTSTFEWIINRCFSLQDVSSMKDTMKKQFEWDEARSENEHVMGINGLYSDADQLQVNDEEKRRLKDELIQMEASKRELEGMLKSATDKIETLMVQLQESETKIAQLEKELETLRTSSRDVIEDQIQNEKLLNEDLNSQLMVARAALNDTQHKFSCLEVALEDKSNACQELESTCLELQLQLQSLTKKDILKTGTEQEERKLQTGLEITAASEKLAECQETILNLGKQLKALAAPKEAELLDKVISVTPSTVNKKSRSSSLLDKMLADNDDDDEEDTEGFKSPQMKEIICTNDPRKPPTQSSNNSPSELLKTLEHCIGPKETRYKYEGALAIVPSKKRGGGGGGLLRKLLLRRKKGSSKKLSIPMVA